MPPPAAAARQESPGGGLPWEGRGTRGGDVPVVPPLWHQPLRGPRGIPGEGAGKQVFVNSSCHMREKHQAPAARSLVTGKNKIERALPDNLPPARVRRPARAGTR